ncbi:MAG: DUF1616 domain-containing protein [Candidatus Heimdallarchaeota archaeon]|nr:DUF1616 domain-containing protein [Candidatus Heimdallarchaeota archaeon]
MTEEKPKTVRKLSERAVELSKKDKNLIYNSIREMEQEGEIRLGSEKIERKLPKTISQYFLQIHYYSIEFWTLIVLTTIFFLTVLLIPQGSPFYFLRVIMGVTYGFVIPGWAISSIIFPKLYETIDQIERTLLAIGINVGTMIFGGLILDQIWAIDNLPFVIVLGSLTIVSAIGSGIIRILIGSDKITLLQLRIKDRIFKKDERDEKEN